MTYRDQPYWGSAASVTDRLYGDPAVPFGAPVAGPPDAPERCVLCGAVVDLTASTISCPCWEATAEEAE